MSSSTNIFTMASKWLNQFQRQNTALYSIVLVVVTAIVTVVVNSIAAKVQDDPPVMKSLEKVSLMIERMALDFYGKVDEDSKRRVTEEVLRYLEKEVREKYVTKDEFKKSQSYMTDPKTGNITVLRVRDNHIYAVSINPNDCDSDKQGNQSRDDEISRSRQ